MRQELKKIATLAGLFALGACTNAEENVLFVTATEIDIGYDAQIGNINIGYDRNEFVAGPQYVDTGGTPPVASSISSNLSVLSPKINQVYATGDAARIATGLTPEPDKKIGDSDKFSGARRAMFFGTNSSFGLKATVTQSTPSSVTLGYKRKEISIIPLRTAADRAKNPGPDKYASVYASIDIDGTVSDVSGTGTQLTQFFATGSAANQLAKLQPIKDAFAAMAEAGAKSAAYEAGVQLAEKLIPEVDAIGQCIQKRPGPYDTTATRRLNDLVSRAGIGGAKANRLKSAKSQTELSGILQDEQPDSIGKLSVAIKSAGATCEP